VVQILTLARTHRDPAEHLSESIGQHGAIIRRRLTMVKVLLEPAGAAHPNARAPSDSTATSGVGRRAESKVVVPMTSPRSGPARRSPDPGIFRRASHPAVQLGLAAAAFALLAVAGIALRPGQDLGLARPLNELHTGALGVVASATYNVFEPVPSVVLTAAIAAMFWIVRDLRTGAAFAGVVALTWIPAELLKLIVHRGRPDAHLMPYPFLPVQVNPSFPSGHTAFIVALVVALAFVARGTRWHPIVVGVGTVLIVLVAVTLAIDAVHYPTDIAASIVWSLAIAPAARLVWVDWVMPRIPFLAVPRATTVNTAAGQDGSPAPSGPPAE